MNDGNLAFRLVVLVLMPIGLTLLGATLSLRTGREVSQGIASRSWPSVVGTVRHSGWKSYQENGSFIGDNYDASPFLHEPDVAYEYVVDGHSREGHRVAFGDHRDGNIGYVKGIVARYPAGARVAVYFDPRLPSRSALEPGVGGWAVAFLLISVFFLLAGIAWCIAAASVLLGRTPPPESE